MKYKVADAHKQFERGRRLYRTPDFNTIGAAEQFARRRTRRKGWKTLVFWINVGQSPRLVAEVQYDGMMRLWTDMTPFGVSLEHYERPYVFIEDKS